MYSDKSQPLATVCPPDLASAALAATDVRLDRAPIPYSQAFRILWQFHNFTSKFVTQHTRIGVDGMSSRQGMEIASAHSDTLHSNQSLAFGRHWTGNFKVLEFARSVQQNLSHKCYLMDNDVTLSNGSTIRARRIV